MSDERCKGDVRETSWSHRRCRNRAATPRGYCRTHDPALQAERAKARQPSKFERQGIYMDMAERFLRERLSSSDHELAMKLIRWGYAAGANPPWPPPQPSEPDEGTKP